MGDALLHVIKETFGYSTSTLSYYKSSGFVDITAIGLLSNESKVRYLDYFQKIDPFAPQVRNAYAQDPNITIMPSSVLFKNEHNDYYQFLRCYGVWWALAMPIGGYTLTVYKTKDQGDFTSHEKEALRLLTNVIRSKYTAQQEIASHKISLSTQSDLLDSLNVGMICANENLQVQYCNQTAFQYLKQVTNSENIQQGTNQLLSLINQQSTRSAGIHASRTLHYKSHLIILDEVGSKNNHEPYYTITIYSDEKQKNMEENIVLNCNLTQREFEVAQLIASGNSYQQVADTLYISINTVRTHIKNVYKKTGVTNQRALSALIH